jgi:hypothetical protein
MKKCRLLELHPNISMNTLSRPMRSGAIFQISWTSAWSSTKLWRQAQLSWIKTTSDSLSRWITRNRGKLISMVNRTILKSVCLIKAWSCKQKEPLKWSKARLLRDLIKSWLVRLQNCLTWQAMKKHLRINMSRTTCSIYLTSTWA